MAGTGVGKFSSTASSNTANLTVNFAENMAPSNVNNAARELMAHIRDMYEQLGDGYFEFGDGDGTYTIARVDADTLTIATAADLSAIYFAGRKIRVTDGGANVVEGTITSTSHGSSLQTVNLTGISLASGTPTKVELGIDTAAFGGKVILDDDGDTYIEAPTDDTIDIYVAGAKDFVITANTFTAESGSTIAAQALTATSVTATGDISLDGGSFVFNESSADKDFRIESNDNANMLFVDGGNNVSIMGSTVSEARVGQPLAVTAHGGTNRGGMAINSFLASSNGPLFDFNKSRNNTAGSHTVVQSGDSLGTIIARGDDGDEFVDAAYISFDVDGTPGGNDMPGRITFGTTADGANGGTERMRIDNAGNVLVGTTSLTVGGATSGSGFRIDGEDGILQVACSGNSSGIFNRTSSDGAILSFRKNGSEVGSIGVDNSDNLFISGNASHAGFEFGSSSIVSYKNGTSPDNTISLGGGSQRFANLYLGGGVYLGGTGTANQLDDYEEGTWTPAWNSGANGRSISGTGGYTKVGNLVTVFGYFEIGGDANTGSGDVKFSGLPFTSSSVTAQRAAISILVMKCASAVDGYISGFVEDNSQIFVVREGGIVANGSDLGNHFDQDSEFYLSISYRV